MLAPFTSQRRAMAGLADRYARLPRWIAFSCGLLVVHAASVARFGVRGHGPLISAFILLAEGVACAAVCYKASGRSGPIGHYFWRLIALSFFVWIVAELAGTIEPPGVVQDLLFVFSTFPFGMTLFLEPDYEPARLDPLHWA